MERISPERRDATGLPLWAPITAALLLALLFLLLSASGELLSPLVDWAGVFDYVHEFAHDGRHLLVVPCH